MKKRVISLLVVLCLSAVMLVPAGAANEEDRVTSVGEKDSAVVNNDEALKEYDGETMTPPPATTGEIGRPVIGPSAVNDVVVLKGRAFFSEKNVGGHYYAFSGYNNAYGEAFANIKLPTGFNNKNGIRNGYVSLGLYGSKHGVDLGLQNTGSGWRPYAYDVGGKFTTFDAYKAPSGATNAIIVVKPVSTTKVHMYIQFKNASGGNVGNTFDRDISVASGNFVSSSGKIMCRYYRFASLVPTGTDNQSDGTYMTGGQFTNCQLHDRSGYVSWGINTARVTDAWKVSSSKVTLSYTTYNDTFSIRHS